MNANEMFPSKYLKAADIGESKPIVTIEKVIKEEVGQGDQKDVRPVIYFSGKEKGVVCNKTNWNTLINLFGYETDDWTGKKVRLMVQEVAFQGKMTPALRFSSMPVTQDGPVKAPSKPAKTQEEIEADMELAEEDIPF